MRAVARLGDDKLGLYGKDPYESCRIDSFLDASLVFARDSQIYLLALGSRSLSEDVYHRTRDAFAVYMAGINSALSAGRGFIVGDRLTLADVCFVAELALFHNEKPRAQDLKKRGLEPLLNWQSRRAVSICHCSFRETLETSRVRSRCGPIYGKDRTGDSVR
jgi:glutathione S-transferase